MDQLDENEVLKVKMRMIIVHVTGGRFNDISMFINDICCEIIRFRNEIFQVGKDFVKNG